ncbi:MAG: AIM24 family protein [Acidimicrobiales bacterium]
MGRFVQIADPDGNGVILQQSACGPPRRAWVSRARSVRHPECGIGTLRREAAARLKEDAMQDTVQGTTMPVLEVTLDPGETILSEDGEFSWMTDTIQMSTNFGGGAGGKGVVGALKRAVAGGTFVFNTYTAQGGPGMVAFAAKLPGKILPIEVAPGNEFICHRHGFLAGLPGIQIAPALQQSFSGGIFGGEGFILQRLSGTARAWIELSGEIRAYDLAAGETLRAHPGHVGLFQASVTFAVQRVPGMANHYMGKDGHHFVQLTGPGRVYLQSLPLPILAGALEPYVDKGDHHDSRSAVEGGAVGGIIGGLLH